MVPRRYPTSFGGERSEKVWPRYRQKFLLAGQSYKQYLAGPLPYFLQVTDLFFRPLFAFFIIELRVTKGDPCECDTFSDGSLGGAYRCGKRLRMGKSPST